MNNGDIYPFMCARRNLSNIKNVDIGKYFCYIVAGLQNKDSNQNRTFNYSSLWTLNLDLLSWQIIQSRH